MVADVVRGRVAPRQSVDDAHLTALALAAGAGDRYALADFVRATQDDVWRFVAHLTDVDRADDLTQDTYLRALGSLGSFEARSHARAWLFGVARNTVADEVRRVGRRPLEPRPSEWFEAVHQPSAQAGLAVELRDVLDALDRDRREAFVLTQLLGFSYAETAQVCGCAVGTVRSRVARARAQLIDLWPTTDDAPAHRCRAG